MNKFLLVLPFLFGLTFGGVASAVTIDIHDGDYNIFDPDPAVIYEVFPVVGGPDIFSFGFGFSDPADSFELIIDLPSNFVGDLQWIASSGLDGTGLGFDFGSLLGGESVSILVGLFGTASPSNVEDVYISLQALDAPSLTTLPTSAVPIPASLWLFGSGLIGLVGVARRRRRNL